jgi:hypothetical protein
MPKDYTLANESLASIKATHSELQTSFSHLSDKHKNLEASYSALWESTKANPKATLDYNASVGHTPRVPMQGRVKIDPY